MKFKDKKLLEKCNIHLGDLSTNYYFTPEGYECTKETFFKSFATLPIPEFNSEYQDLESIKISIQKFYYIEAAIMGCTDLSLLKNTCGSYIELNKIDAYHCYIWMSDELQSYLTGIFSLDKSRKKIVNKIFRYLIENLRKQYYFDIHKKEEVFKKALKITNR